MLRPTLIIGIGSSGLFIVDQVQKLFYETFQKNSLPIFKYMYIETDQGKAVEETPDGNDIVSVRAHVKNLRVAIEKLEAADSRRKLDWIPEDIESRLASINMGAGGIRPGGRMALWERDNFTSIYSQIAGAWQSITHAQTIEETRKLIEDKFDRFDTIQENPIVYVVGTLCGGTASGMFIDIGYMIRHICQLESGAALHGIFLVPPSISPGGSVLDMAFGNTWGSLKELEYYRDQDTGGPYEEIWPNSEQIKSSLPPYRVAYLVSPEYNDASLGGFKSIMGLYKVVGLQLFCNLLGMSSFRESAITDGLQRVPGFYGTWGISGVIYPKYSISERVACRLGADLCDCWLGQFNWLDKSGQEHPINEPVIMDESSHFFDQVLEKSRETLFTHEGMGVGLRGKIEVDVDKILSGQHASPRTYIENEFTAASDSGYYARTNANVHLARDVIIRQVREKIAGEIGTTENIAYGKKYLEGIRRAVEKTLAFYENLGIPSNVSGWQALVDQEAGNILEKPHRYVFLKREVLVDRLTNLLTKLQMYFLSGILKHVATYLEEGGLKTTGENPVEMPSLKALDDMRNKVSRARTRLSGRENDIVGEMLDTSVPVLRVWSSGGFESDCSELKRNFELEFPTARARQVSNKPLFDLLEESKADGIFDLLKRKYQGIVTVKLPDIDVIATAKKDIQQVSSYVRRALTGLLRLERGGVAGSGVPRFAIGSDQNQINELLELLAKTGDHVITEFGPAHSKGIKCLKNAVIFYEEKLQVNPLTDLVSRAQLDHWFCNAPKDTTGQSFFTNEAWQSFRLAYGTEHKLLVRKAGALMRFIRDFGIVWSKQPSGKWEPVSKRESFDNLKVAISNPPIYEVKLSGRPISKFEINPENPEAISMLANEPQVLEMMRESVVFVVCKMGESSLVTLFDDEVRPALERMKGDPEARRATKFYFGDSQKKLDGLVQRMIKGQF